jgi:SpoVK/Ycf46/Vps4 family AAA+-type ATPase
MAPGTYIIVWRHRPVVVSYYERSDKSGYKTRHLEMWTVSIDKEFFNDFMNIVDKSIIKTKYIYVKSYGTQTYCYNNTITGIWYNTGKISKRRMSDTVLDDRTLKTLMDSFNRFYNKPEHYKRYNIPYKLCILLSGPPGMGKTSLIKSLGTEFDCNLYTISLSSITDELLPFVFGSVDKRSILVFEDVDCMTIDRDIDEQNDSSDGKTKKPKGVSLSAFINALDGIVVSKGLVVIMTTNYPEKLDSALTRQERVHLHCKLERSIEVYEKMFKRFFPDAPANRVATFANNCMEKQLNLADVQARCIRYLDDVDAALDI